MNANGSPEIIFPSNRRLPSRPTTRKRVSGISNALSAGNLAENLFARRGQLTSTLNQSERVPGADTAAAAPLPRTPSSGSQLNTHPSPSRTKRRGMDAGDRFHCQPPGIFWGAILVCASMTAARASCQTAARPASNRRASANARGPSGPLRTSKNHSARSRSSSNGRSNSAPAPVDSGPFPQRTSAREILSSV